MSVDLTRAIYTTPEAARLHLESLHWPDGPRCRHCGSPDATRLEGKSTRPGVIWCNACGKPFTVTVGTIMHRSKIPLNKWVLCAHLLAASKKGISAHQLHRMAGVTYKTAWFLLHRLRAAAAEDTGPIGGGSAPVEVDEYTIGKKGSPQVLAMVERGAEARAVVVPDTKRRTLHGEIAVNVTKGTMVYTDGSMTHYTLPLLGYPHLSVDHSRKEYARGPVTVNSAEAFFAVLRRGMVGTYQHCGARHAAAYVAEFAFRHNTRTKLGWDDEARAERLLKQGQWKRLTYARLTGKVAND